jgi:membrane protein required for colicin V production
MNWLDIVIIVAITVPTVIGLRIGMIKAALSLAGLIVGVIVAGRYYLPLSQRLSFISSPSVAEIAAFIIILIGIMIIAAVLAQLLKWTASVIMLGWVNHLGGAVFGLVLGAILCGALLAIWVKFLGVTEAITESNLASILVDFFPLVLALLPDEFDAVRPFFQ